MSLSGAVPVVLTEAEEGRGEDAVGVEVRSSQPEEASLHQDTMMRLGQTQCLVLQLASAIL